MKIKDLLQDERFTLLNNADFGEKEIKTGYISDLLSWVMAHAKTDCAWITIQTHVNIIAVATLLEIACIIIPEDEKVTEDTLTKANDENLPIISTPLTAYEAACVLFENGVK